MISQLIAKATDIPSINHVAAPSASDLEDDVPPVPDPEDASWTETGPIRQPWFAGTYPESEFLPCMEVTPV